MNCYSCEIELSQSNKSIEHIFINAIGGRLKSNQLLCKKCNNDLGNLLDSELAKQCNHLMNFLLLDREKGSFQPIVGKTNDGEEFILDGAEIKSKSNFSIEKNGENVNVSFNGSEEKELKKYFTQLSKKYPQVNVEEILEKANHSKYYLNEPINVNLNIGGKIAMRAIAKIAVNFYLLNGGKRNHVEHIINYIKNGGSTGFVQYYYGVKNNYLKVSDNNIYHYINLVGKEGNLYCYLELFGTLKFIIILSDNYLGDNLDFEYAYNLISKEEVNIGLKLNLSKEHLNEAIKGKFVQIENIQENLSEIMKIGHKRQSSKHLSKLIHEATQNTLGKYKEGTPITEDMANEFINELATSIAIYMTRKNHNQKRTYVNSISKCPV